MAVVIALTGLVLGSAFGVAAMYVLWRIAEAIARW
jgi:hypothetical protein